MKKRGNVIQDHFAEIAIGILILLIIIIASGVMKGKGEWIIAKIKDLFHFG